MKEPLFRYVDTDGDGTGTKNAVGNYASAAETFYIAPPATKVFYIHRLIVTITDAGAPDSGKYGNNIVLTNGILASVTNNSTEIDLCDGVPVKTNADWGRMCYDMKPDTFGAGNDSVTVRWTFSKSGQPLILAGDRSDQFTITLNDDFSDLIGHYFMIQGYSATIPYRRDAMFDV